VLVQDQNSVNQILKQMWVNAEAEDESYNELCQTIHKKQRSFSTVLKVRVFIMKCFLSDEESYSLQKTLSVISEPLCRTDSVYTWLNNDWTLRKRCNWCSLSWQFFWPEMLQNVCTFCQIVTNVVWTTAEKMLTFFSTCIKANLTKIFIDFVVDLLSSEVVQTFW
jgi:hypothetical protein